MSNQVWSPDALVRFTCRDVGDDTHALPTALAGYSGPAEVDLPIARGLLTTAAAVLPIPAGTSAITVVCSVLSKVGVGPTTTPVVATQEKQTIAGGDATSGNFTLTFQGQTTGSLTYDESAADVVTGLVAISSIGAAGVTATGGPLNTTPIVVTFTAGILDGDQPLMSATTVDLAGGVDPASMLPVITQTTTAVTQTAFAEAATSRQFLVDEDDLYLYLTAVSGTGTYRVTYHQ